MNTQRPLPTEGASYELTRTVDDSLMTPAFGKPDIEVLASPAVVYLMEVASLTLVEERLPEELTSVGTGLTFKHLRPSWAGAEILVRATVQSVSEKRVDLLVEAFEREKLVATAEHSRAVVPTRNFTPPAKQEAQR